MRYRADVRKRREEARREKEKGKDGHEVDETQPEEKASCSHLRDDLMDAWVLTAGG